MRLSLLLLLTVFALTLFVSATLLFLVQPMIGKMILPLLGGTPAVWNTCMVFFQALPVMVQRINSGGSNDSNLPHSSAKHLSETMNSMDE